MSLKTRTIQLDAPNVGAMEKKYLKDAVDAGYVSTVGPFVPKFESKFAAFLGVKAAVSTQSGTAALHMALHELRLGKGDEVIVPALTFAATVNPVIYVGASPVFADVDSVSWNIDAENIERNITKRTKAVIVVHLYGNPCDMAGVMKVAKIHGLSVIEDATESLGAKFSGKHTGTFGDFGCFSFNGNKVITTGGGGMIIGHNRKGLKHIRFLVNQAREGSNSYYHPEVGFNYRMTSIEAALGLAQMERLGAFLKKKARFNQIYSKELGRLSGIHFQETCERGRSSYWLSCVYFDRDIDISEIQEKLGAAGIPTRRVFMPVTEFPPYRHRRKSDCVNSRRIYQRSLCLPSSTLNTEDDIYRICGIFKNIVNGMRAK